MFGELGNDVPSSGVTDAKEVRRRSASAIVKLVHIRWHILSYTYSHRQFVGCSAERQRARRARGNQKTRFVEGCRLYAVSSKLGRWIGTGTPTVP